MVEYIDRNAAMNIPALPKAYREYQTANIDDAYDIGWNDALENLKNIPVEIIPNIKHGKWELAEDGWYCSVRK